MASATRPPQPPLDEAVARWLDRGFSPDLVAQPIVDLKRGAVVGYEALSRFAGPPAARPDEWFQAALRLGRGTELELRVLQRALALREQLPSNCFLSINIAPEALLDSQISAQLRRQPLSRIVFELTEHTAVTDYDVLARAISEVRSLGAFVAVDDAGAGYASLQHILILRPDFVKLDRALIAGVHDDEAKAALVEMFGGFASRIDAWLLAEGIEEIEELDRLLGLDVPLGQGYLLGRPDAAMRPLAPWLSQHIEQRALRCQANEPLVRELCENGSTVQDGNDTLLLEKLAGERAPAVALLDARGRCDGVAMVCGHGHVLRRRPLSVIDRTPAHQALDRALTRPTAARFDPLVCCDDSGRYLGMVRVERLIDLVRRQEGADLPKGEQAPTSRPSSPGRLPH